MGSPDGAHYAICIISGLLTAAAALLMAGLYGLYGSEAPVAALVGAVFISVLAVYVQACVGWG